MDQFTNKYLPFAQTNNYDKLVIDYINDNTFLKDFYSYSDDLSGIKERIDSYKNARLNRQNLIDVLNKQYKLSGISDVPEKVTENINSLGKQNTFTVTSGHQLNIFCGPLYVFYKIFTAINIADKLNRQYQDYHFVPVFWLATEDHDMEEISFLNLFGKKYQWETDWKGVSGKAPVDNLNKLIDELTSVFGTTTSASELILLFSKAYLESNDLEQATRKIYNSIFGKYGLVILDGNEKSFKEIFSDVIKDELNNQTTFSIVGKTISELEKKYHSQAKPREINLFYIGENYRERIVKENDKYNVLNKDLTFNKEDINIEIDTKPENFSPNVLLRPIYQECILPNIVFTGGPAELGYWLELRKLFDNYSVPMPVLFLRCSALIMDNNIINRLKKLSINVSEVFLPVDDLIKQFIVHKDVDTSFFQSSHSAIAEEFDKLEKKVAEADPSLGATVLSEHQKIITALKSIEDKMIRSLKKKSETEVNQIRKLKEKLFPDGKLQERFDSFIPYYLIYGENFFEILKENLDPFRKEFCIIKEEKVGVFN